MQSTTRNKEGRLLSGFLNAVEKAGNKLPEPALIFFYMLLGVMGLSLILSWVDFGIVNPVTSEAVQVNNLLAPEALVSSLTNMITTFTTFAPLGIVLVAMLGVGVAERSGFINTALKKMLNVTPRRLLTPMLIFVAMFSHVAADAGYVLVIPLGAIIFMSAGRHPLVGIAAAFSGVSGGFAANMVPTGNDALLQGFTQAAAQLLDSTYTVNTLCNLFFGIASSVVITLTGWWVTERIVEPRVSKMPIDGDYVHDDDMSNYSPKESKAFILATLVMLLGLGLLAVVSWPADSIMRGADGSLTGYSAPIMKAIVPLIFLVFIIPGIVYGYASGTFSKGKDVIDAMNDTMSKMGSYMVMAFFCAMFIKAFGDSNIGTLLALAGADALKAMSLPGGVTIVGMIVLTAVVNILIGSASAKWALLSPIMVPMLMAVGISPELTQAAFRIGDSTTNIITPLMVFFPLVVVYCQRYVKSAGVGTLVSMMLPYSIVLFVVWSLFLLIWWGLGMPLGLAAPYTYPVP
ncbi:MULTISPECIES: AbgT family transporter [Mangrovibacter]|uniref:Para-aminobenzoyl-glutamate transporter family n=1 Tax=Mangrovibacter plantisponsor TaxID=451513 RepID=A0A317Q131_9ENTR|nr:MULTISPECIES: AbgT family transporter [Mangrovibacter]KEA53253.1 aminobenzoyl-glutamate transporter [Mangrovibacter sp. MFB070]PWW09051.1 para-aminobenzoyl-glutamate transporter family [Mangrovibacter plantisponsor]